MLLRCVTCAKAFCDECSGGADFQALEGHPGEWERVNGFYPPSDMYEYVRCPLCMTKPLVLGQGGGGAVNDAAAHHAGGGGKEDTGVDAKK